MTRVALITTTINFPHVLTKWAKGMTSSDALIVAGDRKSPHNDIVRLLNNITEENNIPTQYIPPASSSPWASSEIIGWNSIQRRNIALLEALKLRPCYVLTVDDDNAPSSPNQIALLIDEMRMPRSRSTFIKTNTGWLNPGRDCLTARYMPVIHRGFPLNRRKETPLITHGTPCDIGVAAMLWTGAPDIDAIDRIVNDPIITRVARAAGTVLTPGTWAPFNSQATMYLGELAPLMMVWPGVGRYDDIWASYLARAVMDRFKYGVYYGYPTVHQDRNEHDLFRDLEGEMHGMRWTPRFTDILRGIDLTNDTTIMDAMLHVYDELVRLGSEMIPLQTRRAFTAWQRDLEAIKWES